MSRFFNVNADCQPDIHYMVDLSDRLRKIKEMVDAGQYFTINRARQYGKTTTLQALREYLKNDYVVVSLDFQMISSASFENEQKFVSAFSEELLESTEYMSDEIIEKLNSFVNGTVRDVTLSMLFKCLSKWCGQLEKKSVLLIDEVDSASDNQVFLDFLAQIRGYYIKRRKVPTFQSVILAGVYDIKNIRRKLRPEEAHKFNSPWNIAADFLVDMSFSAKDIAGMLQDYENDKHTGMDIDEIAGLLYDYTSGYPFLVSRLCKLIDERISGSREFPDEKSAWTRKGFQKAVNMLLGERNTLFDSLTGKMYDYPELKNVVSLLLFQGQKIIYNPDDPVIDMALMFGFVKVENGYVAVANRIFETRLYNMFLTLPEVQDSKIYRTAYQNKNQFIKNGHLDMKQILEKFVVHFNDIYDTREQKFHESDGRRYFMLYLKPIINGTGNYYIESQTRSLERTDMIVDYNGEQYIIEMKVWHGNAYNMRGEKQLCDYLEYYHLKKGYMLSFNFNKKKEVGVKEIILGDKVIVEAVV